MENGGEEGRGVSGECMGHAGQSVGDYVVVVKISGNGNCCGVRLCLCRQAIRCIYAHHTLAVCVRAEGLARISELEKDNIIVQVSGGYRSETWSSASIFRWSTTKNELASSTQAQCCRHVSS